MGLFDQSQGLMGLGQPQRNRAQGTEVNGQFVPTFSNPDGSYMSEGMMVNPQQPQYTSPMNQPQGNMPPMPQGNMPQIGQPLGQFNPATTLPDGTRNSEGGSYEYPQQFNLTGGTSMPKMPLGTMVNGQFVPSPFENQNPMPQPQGIPRESFFSGPNAGQIPNGFSMINGELVNLRDAPRSDLNTLASIAPNNTQSTTPALNPTPQPPQIFQPMQQQPSNPVNTQTVQPNFMGQTPFGQAQTGQFTSTNPFVQAAQANAQGNLGGALQATAANRINQQTPYGSLSYQQTGTDAQGNPIWSANQQLSPELQQLTQSSLAGLQASQANPMTGINPGDTYSNAIMQRLAPQQSQAREALDAQLANQGIMPGSEAYNRAKVLQGQTQNDALTSAIVGGMQTGLQAQGL
jgi:hypothetical protein